MVGYVYKTTNKLNGKVYIGKCKSSQFNKDYYGSGKLLWEDINKYGKKKFRVEIIKKCDTLKELNEMEIYYIDYYRKKLGRNNCYNIAKGGNGGWGYSSPEPKSVLIIQSIKKCLLRVAVILVLLAILVGVVSWIK